MHHFLNQKQKVCIGSISVLHVMQYIVKKSKRNYVEKMVNNYNILQSG